MNRRIRRSGINYIESERERNLTYFKRRAGLYKSIADLSTLTGAKVALVVEAESEKKSAFGTPSVTPIIESFLSGSTTIAPVDEEETARIAFLQDELFRLDKDKTVEEKRAKVSKSRLQEILETLESAKFISDDVEDLGAHELRNMLHRLLMVNGQVDNQVKAATGNQLGVSNRGIPSLPFSSSSWPFQINIPPRHLSWDLYLQASSQHGQSQWAPRSHSSFVEHATLPSEQEALPLQLLHHRAQMMPSPAQPNEAHQYNYCLPQAPPPPFQQQLDLDQNYEYTHNNGNNFIPVVPPNQNLAHSDNFNLNPVVPPQVDQLVDLAVDSQQLDGYQWPPLSPYSNLYFGANLHELSVHLGVADENEDEVANVNNDDHGPLDCLHQQAYDEWLALKLLDSPILGENSNNAAPNYHIGDMGQLGPR